jgi:hypothetical protein
MVNAGRPSKELLRVWGDFNARDKDGALFILYVNDKELSDQIEDLGLSAGDRIILHQDDVPGQKDFEIAAVLRHQFIEYAGKVAWSALPDELTFVRHHT